MSIPITRPVQIKVKLGDAVGLNKVKAALRAMILRAMRKALRATEDYMYEIVPESIYRDPPYPLSYDSEGLLEGAVDILNTSYRKMKVGRGLKSMYYFDLGFPASYAKHVDKMRNVNWSKPGSRGGFYCLVKGRLVKEFKLAMKAELAKQSAIQLSLAKYIGVGRYGE